MADLERENEMLREQLRVLGSNFDHVLREMDSMPQPQEAAFVDEGEAECGGCYSMLEVGWRYCPWCGGRLIWGDLQ